MSFIRHPYYSNVICSYLEEVADKAKNNYIADGIFIWYYKHVEGQWGITFSDRSNFSGCMAYGLNTSILETLPSPRLANKTSSYHRILIPQLKEAMWKDIDKYPCRYKANNVWLPKPDEELKEQLMIAFERLFDESGTMTKKAI